ncbi:DUF3251 domain-containing protein [Citrobacter sp. JGM124]|uniref:DUF3251 domain-containing protein n=1 Tax=Citrobacter sp. JGM124 TaxID=2799789 RepID=UPI001BA6F49B|nr:DUF3251 domain-containing protein [Citrobacter sp. JGM124]MBS0848742.1 DUF3251 domain-containing protein [Citrobacter sp. JGM124]
MSLSGRKTILVVSILNMTACASPSNLHQIQHEIKSLNQDMQRLSEQAVSVSQQNALNAHSTQGVYLLPSANTPALVESNIGMLKMSLVTVAPAAGGTRVTLLIQQNRLQPLPAFSAIIEWNSHEDNANTEPKKATGQQFFSVPVRSATADEATITLILPDTTVDTLRWVRIHQITPLNQAVALPTH